MKRRTLMSHHLLHAIKHGEFSPEVVCSRERVVVIMTQDWCSQWKSMCEWLPLLEDADDIEVYEAVYNTHDCFSEFLALKEQQWGNSLIPYIRYYRGGKLVGESNYVTREDFLSNLRGPGR